MLDILNKHLEKAPFKCVVATWISSLETLEKEAFELLSKNSSNINVSALYAELYLQQKLPFKVTLFRSHMKGYCTCQTN